MRDSEQSKVQLIASGFPAPGIFYLRSPALCKTATVNLFKHIFWGKNSIFVSDINNFIPLEEVNLDVLKEIISRGVIK